MTWYGDGQIVDLESCLVSEGDGDGMAGAARLLGLTESVPSGWSKSF
jgi:hypothetical protein